MTRLSWLDHNGQKKMTIAPDWATFTLIGQLFNQNINNILIEDATEAMLADLDQCEQLTPFIRLPTGQAKWVGG